MSPVKESQPGIRPNLSLSPSSGRSRRLKEMRTIVPGSNVFDAALNRIRWLYDEFPQGITVSSSGGKDSTCVVELALIVARERGLLPLHVVWLDQEAEYRATVEYQRSLAARPEIAFDWYQIPFLMTNATQHAEEFLRVWDPAASHLWPRQKEPPSTSIHENPFTNRDGSPIDRFHKLMKAINANDGGVGLTGVRMEESLSRRIALTSRPSYKWVTWGSKDTQPIIRNGQPHPRFHLFHPIYDWTFRDVWHAIEQHHWDYNRIYDIQFSQGVRRQAMRVSCYTHVPALEALAYLQEAEPDTYDDATRRLDGIATQGRMGEWLGHRTLPYMFGSWEEYMAHLINNLAAPEHRDDFRLLFDTYCRILPNVPSEEVAKKVVQAVIENDHGGVGLQHFVYASRKHMMTGWVRP